ncbi:MAG TPA: hypothetical protein VHR85_04190 [Nocardioides sp.]|jgi:hypothetical protein|nr:hypothetical protein [Nocardioides sp.]
MSTPEESQSPRERTWIYIVVGAISIVLVVLGLVLFDSAKETKEAEAKADQYIAALETVGVPAPPRDEVVRVLGSDGGATCDDPNDALSRATLKSVMSNGAAGPGMRPVIFDRRYLAGQLLILKIYCPEELPSMQSFVDKLKSGDVAQ